MIRRLRRRHLAWSWLLLGASLVAVTLAVRAPVAADRSNPSIPRPNSTSVDPSQAALSIASRLVGAVGPDLLVYHAPASPTDTARLPADARFLGPLSRRVSELATLIEPAATGRGAILVWSGGHQRIVVAAEIGIER